MLCNRMGTMMEPQQPSVHRKSSWEKWLERKLAGKDTVRLPKGKPIRIEPVGTFNLQGLLARKQSALEYLCDNTEDSI